MSASEGQPRPLVAEIVTTGTELLLGEIVDTNAAWIAQQLRDAGVNLYYKTTVGDNELRLRGVIELGLSRSDVIIVSGGLGPTVDDITRQSIAAATGRPLVQHAGALEALKARFARFGVQMTENNLQQALIPTGATLIENPVGTAPGFIVETEKGAVIAVPGVPREMKHLMTESVLPYIRSRAGHASVIRRRILRTIGIGESTIDSRLGDLMYGSNPTIGLAAHTAQCDVRIAARADTAAAADALLDVLEVEIRSRLAGHIYSTTPEEPFEAVVARLLQAHQSKVAVLESNTQGPLAARLVAGQASYNSVPIQLVLGVSDLPFNLPGLSWQNGKPAPTEAGAAEAAEALRRHAGVDFALAVLGTSGDQEGVYGATSGRTWIGMATKTQTHALLCPFGGTDEYTVTRIGNQALGLLWEALRQ